MQWSGVMKILIILGHPAKKRQSLSEALANAYKEGAIESGHEVRLYTVGVSGPMERKTGVKLRLNRGQNE
jgi:putative NADPH-quinone reductase